MKVKFSPGDKVFAKVRGYPYWPAKIVGPQNESAKQLKYDITFYGTGEKAVVRAEDVQPYLEKRHELGKPKKQKAFNDAMAAIEKDLSPGEAASTPAREDSDPPSAISTPKPDDEGKAEEDGPTPAKVRKSSGRPPKQPVDNIEGVSTPTSARARNKRKIQVEDESKENDSTPETTRAGRKIKITKKLNNESGPKITSPKKKTTDKVENSLDFEHEGITYSLPLDINRPALNCPKTLLDWNNLVNEKANELKDKIIAGDMNLQQAKDSLSEYTRVQGNEKRKEYEENNKEFKILKIEAKLLQLDVKIKKSLSITKPEPFDACKHLSEMVTLPFTALMIKKHPEVVETFKRLCRYVGNVESWTMSDEEKANFKAEAERVRQKSQLVLDKIQSLFNIQEGQSFAKIYSEQLTKFYQATRDLSQDEFFSLVKDPTDTSEG